MPLYEYRGNAQNRIKISTKAAHSMVVGSKPVAEAILRAAADISRKEKRQAWVACDSWYGVDWPAVTASLRRTASDMDLQIVIHPANEMASPLAKIEAYKAKFVTDDPSFGYVNDKGRLSDLMDPGMIARTRSSIERSRRTRTSRPSVIVIYGPGAAIPELCNLFDIKLYFDFTHQPLLWQMWDGKLVPFGASEPKSNYFWKEYYYCDFHLLDAQKRFMLPRMDFYVEAVNAKDLKLLPRASYDEVMSTLVQYPIKEVKIFQPGPWGAYRYKDFWDVPGLGCNAWNELAGPELSILVDIGVKAMINMPVTNLLQYSKQFVGPYLKEALPDMFPLDVWLDDGYFPKPTPAERISMPIHNHPGTDYVKRHFNEPLGRYETYYICEAYEGANTWMGFLETADFDEWERLCRQSDRTGKPIKKWKNYAANHKSIVGDLYLIPPGTTHGHGGNQMVLEMDTVPSRAGTEYSFFMYDFCRPSWDDKKKTMTGKPCRMQIEHGFDIDQCRREDWVRKVLKPRAEVVKWTTDYSMDRYASYGPMPFDIERFHFYKHADNDTQGRFMHVVTLTVGKRVRIQSESNPALCTEIELFQSAVVPACYGKYKFVNLTGGQSTITQMRWKNG